MKVRSFPNALTILVGFILLAGIMTYLIPKGSYQRVIDPSTQREVVVPGSFQLLQAGQLSPFEILLCIPRGILKGGEVMVLIFLVGGCFFIVDKTGALKQGVASLTVRMKGKEKVALVLVGILFAMGGATEGMQEEIIPLIPILLVLTRNLGYPPLITIGISFGSAIVGGALSPINPFAVVIAQKVADIPFLTGAIFRTITFLIGVSIWIAMMVQYASKNPIQQQQEDVSIDTTLTLAHKIILSLVVAAFGLLIYGMLSLGWGFNEISAEFFVVGILAGVIGGLGVNGAFVAYTEGFKDLTFAAMVVGFAYGISLLLKEGLIIDSIIHGLFTPLQYIPSYFSAFGMMISQALLHVVVPSYSGQAVLTMPILAPLSDHREYQRVRL